MAVRKIKKILYATPARIVGAAALIQLVLSFVLGLVVGASLHNVEALNGLLPLLFPVQLILLAVPFILGACLNNSPETRNSNPLPAQPKSGSTYPANAPTLYPSAGPTAHYQTSYHTPRRTWPPRNTLI